MTSSRDVAPPTLASELRALAPWLAAALVTWGLALGLSGRRAGPVEAGPAPWQRSYLELSASEQRRYRAVREGIFEVENRRATTKGWPEVAPLVEEGVPPFATEAGLPALAWTLRRGGLYATYVGVPLEGGAARWLVLFIEPEPKAFGSAGEAKAPVDEEHHTLSDGTALHVTVWTQPAEGPPVPEGVLAFPAVEGWTQRVGR